jgi:hypothetical protein
MNKLEDHKKSSRLESATKTVKDKSQELNNRNTKLASIILTLNTKDLKSIFNSIKHGFD